MVQYFVTNEWLSREMTRKPIEHEKEAILTIRIFVLTKQIYHAIRNVYEFFRQLQLHLPCDQVNERQFDLSFD